MTVAIAVLMIVLPRMLSDNRPSALVRLPCGRRIGHMMLVCPLMVIMVAVRVTVIGTAGRRYRVADQAIAIRIGARRRLCEDVPRDDLRVFEQEPLVKLRKGKRKVIFNREFGDRRTQLSNDLNDMTLKR